MKREMSSSRAFAKANIFRTQQKQGGGFTLIELLVVVLIIAILAAVALPQYTKAVEKSRATEVLLNLKALKEANERYYLANDVYATNMDSLDITVKDSNYWTYALSGQNSAYATRNNDKGCIIAFRYDKKVEGGTQSYRHCRCDGDDAYAAEFCGGALGGTIDGTASNGSDSYALP
ncbi:type IV pilus assembly protein PilE [Parelusimicrobium proximum]|uniref:type IV pilin protein n=1 Tax=Parelusimicrobium proximum TaxID=3228953 RepID=UPI003D176E0A